MFKKLVSRLNQSVGTVRESVGAIRESVGAMRGRIQARTQSEKTSTITSPNLKAPTEPPPLPR